MEPESAWYLRIYLIENWATAWEKQREIRFTVFIPSQPVDEPVNSLYSKLPLSVRYTMNRCDVPI